MKKQAIALSLIVTALTGCSYYTNASSLDLYLKGQLEAEQGNLPQALASLTKAIQVNPKMGLAFTARGNVLSEQGNYAAAAKDFEDAVRLEPYDFNANFKLGLMYQYLKRFADAVVAYQKAVEIRPLDPDANMNLALAYTQLGQPFNGLNYAQRAVQGNPESPTANANLGILYVQCGYDAAAIDSLKRLDRIEQPAAGGVCQPGPIGYRWRLQGFEGRKRGGCAGEIQPGQERAGDGQVAGSAGALVFDRLGIAYYKLQEWDQATGAFNDALKMDPKYFTSLNGLGVVVMSQALVSNPPDVAKARLALDCWNKSLEINGNQDKIRDLVDKYGTPK